MNSFVASTAFSILSFRASITFNMRILNHRSAQKSRVNFIFFFFFYLHTWHATCCAGGAPLRAGTSTAFYSHSQHWKLSRLCHSAASSWSMWCCSPHPQQVQETSSVLDSKTSSQLMFISLITGNSIAQSQKIATLYFTFFYFFLAHDLAHNMLCLGGPRPKAGMSTTFYSL